MRRIKRLFIPNRGEVALRVVRACFDEGIESVVGLSEADMQSAPAWVAHQAVCIGPAMPSHSYLDPKAVVGAALATRCDAVHPGYGFLAESPDLSRLCAEHGLVFVGPDAATLELWGDKLAARSLADSIGVPISKASPTLDNAETALREAGRLSYPLMLKAAAGGGGRGMRTVTTDSELRHVFDTAASEARQSFGDARLYLESYVAKARHVEVQVLADRHGRVIHLGTRDCTTQRRFQKLIEEAPAPDLPPDLVIEITHSAVELARTGGHTGAGTVEFLVDRDTRSVVFLEVNGRLQVEHAVSEQVTGIDIVRSQIRVAAGEPLSLTQRDVQFTGHSIEFRITCEDPEDGFRPRPGTITRWGMPAGTSIRLETHCYPGYVVPPYYDSLLAKLIVTGNSRSEALATANRALGLVVIGGVHSSTAFLRDALRHRAFQEAQYHSTWLDEAFKATERSAPANPRPQEAS